MGESFGIWKMGNDEQIMPYIDMANLACGFHASDPLTMSNSVSLANKYSVEIGAHPSYWDLEGFGRRHIAYSLDEIIALTTYQIGALDGFCKTYNKAVSYVKPHGAFYNDMMKDENIFKAVLNAISSYDKNIKLMVLSTSRNQELKEIALFYGITLIFEIFADRNYDDEGFLIPRYEKDAVIEDELDVVTRVETLKERGYIESIRGNKLFLQADTLCVHGDSKNAVDFIKIASSILRK